MAMEKTDSWNILPDFLVMVQSRYVEFYKVKYS